MEFIKNRMDRMSRPDKLLLLENSNLNDREIELLSKRFIQGDTIKECAVYFNLEEDTIIKKQLKAVKKLYSFLI
jgi:hypothetical protein